MLRCVVLSGFGRCITPVGPVALLELVIRPLVAVAATDGPELTWWRLFISWTARRGIVAAAAAATLSAPLITHPIDGGTQDPSGNFQPCPRSASGG
ncbi:hypothetical protein [Streptomyces sp. NPDC056452]|uniref:hypothetical protein n=1 Tax=Streptomyces sp. NPDC056452 TaxID=3345821 RepID=UPI0036B99878